MDWLGGVTVAGGTVMILLALQFGGVSFPWNSATILCLLLFGIATVGLFAAFQWKVSTNPIIPLRIFNHRSNIAALLVNISHAMCCIAMAYFFPVYFQTVLGASPLQSGTWFLVSAGVMAVILIAAGIYTQNSGRYLDVIRLGLVFLTLALGLFIDFPPYRSWPRIIMFQIIVSLGVGPLFQAPLIAFQANLAVKDVAAGTIAFGFIRSLTTAVSLVIGQVIFQSEIHKSLSDLLDAGVPSDLANTIAEGNAISATFTSRQLRTPAQTEVRVAITNALSKMWIRYTAFAAFGLLASFFISKMELSKQHVQTKTGLVRYAKAEAVKTEGIGEV